MKSRHVIALGLSVMIMLAVVGSGAANNNAIVSIQPSSVTREDWFDNRWHHRIYLQVDADGYGREAYPVDVLVDFSSYIPNGSVIDDNSIRVLDNGTEIPSQYDPLNDTAGNVIFVINETMAPSDVKNYTVYFDTEANGLKPVADYGEPTYVTEYETLAEEGKFLGSSPLNGSTDNWFFPPYLDRDDFEYQDRRVGTVKAVWNAWGDGWNGTHWIRQYARAVGYRDSFNVYLTVWSNDTDTDRAWASGLLNISTGSPSGLVWDNLDQGLNVITDDWAVSDFTNTFDWIGNSSGNIFMMANNTVDTYDTGFVYNETVKFGYTSGVGNYALVGSGNEVLEILQVHYDANDTIIDPGDYSLDTTASPREIILPTNLQDGVQINVTFRRKLYGSSQELRVSARNATTRYLIMYDEDDPSETPYTNPDIGSIIFPELVAASNMVVEFWFNITSSLTADYFVNISTNYKEWWYNATNSSSDYLHDPQENEFSMIFSYMNSSSDPEDDVNDFLDSYENPANITILLHENSIPISLVVHEPRDGQSYNGWMEIPTLPKDTNVTINVTAGGETLERVFYNTSKNSTEVEFINITAIPLSSLKGDALDGRIVLYITAEDTNGTRITERFRIFIVKKWYQAITSSIATFLIVLGAAIASFLSMCGLASIYKRKERVTSSI